MMNFHDFKYRFVKVLTLRHNSPCSRNPVKDKRHSMVGKHFYAMMIYMHLIARFLLELNAVCTLTYSAYHVHVKYVDEIKQVVRNEPIMHNVPHLQFVIETASHDNNDEIVHDSTGDNKGPPVVRGVGRVDHKLLPEPDNQYQNSLENANQKVCTKHI